jgi:hypothetical protein
MNTSPQNEPCRYLITIGVPKYEDTRLPELKRVESDVKSIQDIFISEEQGYKLGIEIPQNAKSSEIKRLLTEFFVPAKLKSSDSVIIYYAGHGGYVGAGHTTLGLFTFDSSSESPAGTAIQTTDLVNWFIGNFKNGDPPNILLILDVCYAGKGAGEFIEALAKNFNGIRNTNQGSGFWVIASADAITQVPDGAFVNVLKEVMRDRFWMSSKQGEFLNPLDLKDEINNRLARAHSIFKAEGSVLGGRAQAKFIRLPSLARHISEVIKEVINRNTVIPFLGADINLLDRQLDLDWNPDKSYPPSNDELAAYLNREYFSGNLDWFQCPICDHVPDVCPIHNKNIISRMPLGQVSQNLSLRGTGNLADDLRKIAECKYKPNRLHKFFANLPRQLENKAFSPASMLIVTTAFDSTLEFAFEEANQSFDLYSYIRTTGNHERFELNKYRFGEDKNSEKSSYPTILKLYGPTTWITDNPDNFVITEDQYIEYLTCDSIDDPKIMPADVLERLRQSYNWFLGYNLSHWYLRVILHRIFKNNPRPPRNWWVLLSQLGGLEEAIWMRKGHVDVFNYPLTSYVDELENRLQQFSHKK